jgi:hypothetical protein
VHVRLTRSSIVNSRGDGAAVRVLAHGDAEGVLEMENVTLAGNATYERRDLTMRAVGGALAMGDDSRGTVRNCTFADNASQFGSAIWGADKLAIHNSVFDNIAENEWTPVNCNSTGTGSHNVEWPEPTGGAVDCSPGIERFDPTLAELGDHGGPTVTIPVAEGSPLVDKTGRDCPATDQRGEPRGDPCTLGAYEVTD